MDKEILREILRKVTDKIEEEDDLTDFQEGRKFENYVYDLIQEVGSNYIESEKIYQTGEQSFPDVMLENSGVEVKFTKGNKWEITGNSIFQGTRSKDLTGDVYLLFGKKEGAGIKVKWAEYSECLSTVKVTHSPRFYIDMELPDKDYSTIFEKLDITYDVFRELDDDSKVSEVKKFVISSLGEGEKLWWIDNDEDAEGITPTVTEYKKLNPQDQIDFINEIYVVFPEILSSSSLKFTNVSFYLLVEYQIVNSSLRDTFTSGGREDVIVNGHKINVPQIFYKLYYNSTSIQEKLNNISLDTLKEYWPNIDEEYELERDEVTKRWLDLIDSLAYFDVVVEGEKYKGIGEYKGIKPSDIYKAGLEK